MFDEIVNKMVQLGEYDYLKELGSKNLAMSFNHSKPYYAINTMEKDADVNLGPNSWKQEDHYNDKEIVKKALDKGMITSLHKSLLNDVDFSRMEENDVDSLINSLDSLGVITAKSFIPRLAQILKARYESKNYGYYYSIPHHYVNKMTLSQMDELARKLSKVKNDSTFKTMHFEKQYHQFFQNPEYYECTPHHQIRDLLVSIRNESGRSEGSLKSALLLDILTYGIKLDEYDKNLFIEYIKAPVSDSCLIYKGPSSIQGDGWSHTWANLKLKGKYYSIDAVYKKYLKYFYNLGDNWKDFNKYFDKDWIKRFRIECDFYAGKDLKDDELNLIYASSLTKQVMIELDDSNKDSFGVEDRVRIVTELKNVPKLYVKVFEFNTLNYFKKTKQPFKTDVNLDGLIATKEFEYDFDHPPQKKFRKVFDFPHLDQQVGVFIIELIANGYSSRATIKKGALSLVHKSTIAGHLAFIIDENRNI